MRRRRQKNEHEYVTSKLVLLGWCFIKRIIVCERRGVNPFHIVATMSRRCGKHCSCVVRRCVLLLFCITMCGCSTVNVKVVTDVTIATQDVRTDRIHADSVTREYTGSATAALETIEYYLDATTIISTSEQILQHGADQSAIENTNTTSHVAIGSLTYTADSIDVANMHTSLNVTSVYVIGEGTTDLHSVLWNETEEETTEAWRSNINAVLLCMASTGVVANVLTFVTLTVNGRAFSHLTVVLLKHQALIDMIVCVLASCLFMQTAAWRVGQSTVDSAICFVWHSRFLYWVPVTLSIWNIVFIAVDRLMAVCFPLKYKLLSPRHLKIAIGVMYVPCVFSSAPCIRVVSFAHGRCYLTITLPPQQAYNFYYGYSVYWLLFAYLIPVTLFLVLYGYIVSRLRRQSLAVVASTAQSQARTKSTVRVTRCAITVTVVFMASLGYDSIHFCLGSVGVTVYDFGVLVHLIGLLLTVVNSLANPFVYFVFMPAFRRSMRTTICRRDNVVRDEISAETPISVV